MASKCEMRTLIRNPNLLIEIMCRYFKQGCEEIVILDQTKFNILKLNSYLPFSYLRCFHYQKIKLSEIELVLDSQ